MRSEPPRPDAPVKRAIARDMLGTLTTDGALLVLGMTTGALTARWLLPAGRGTLAAALFWPSILAGLGLVSLTEATTYRIGSQRARAPVIAASSLSVALVLAILVTVIGYVWLPALLGPVRAHLVPWARLYLLVFIPCNFITLTLLASDQGGLSFTRYNLLRLLVPVVYLAGLIGLRMTHHLSVGWVITMNLAGTVVVALLRLGLHGRELTTRPSETEIAALLRQAGRFHLTTLLLFLATEVDQFAILRLWNDTALGLYAAASAIASTGMAVISGAFHKVLFPHVANLQAVDDQAHLLRHGVRQAARWSAALAIPLVLMMPWVIPLVFGSAFLPAVVPAQVLVVASALMGMNAIVIQGLRGAGQSATGSIAAAITLGLFLMLVWPLGRTFGLTGVAMTLGVANAATLGYLYRWVYCHDTHRRADLSASAPHRSRVTVAMLGARQHYALPKILHRAQRLGRVYSDTYLPVRAWPARLLSWWPPSARPPALERWLGHADGELPVDQVRTFHLFGFRYRWVLRRARTVSATRQIYVQAAQTFAARVIRHGFSGAAALWSYNGPASELFTAAKTLGIRCLLEQIHVPQSVARPLLNAELVRWPGWEPGLAPEPEADELERREMREWELADLIIGGSAFALSGIPHPGKCRVVPYGVPLEDFQPAPRRERSSGATLHVLFVGGTSLRKGAPYFLEAVRQVGPPRLEARVIGPVTCPPERLAPYRAAATFLGTVPRRRLVAWYHWADLLVVPSLCEGSAVVTYEAMACGLPVIATPNAGAWMQDGVEGLLVPIRDAAALAAALERCAADPAFLRACRERLLATRERLGLEAYQRRLLGVIDECVTRPGPSQGWGRE